jgi:PTH1 family peptidyl-tRNA hydrolase
MFFGRKTGPVEWIVVFLGNPGAKYTRTRHNAGFMTADLFSEKTDVKIDRLKFRALTAAAELGGCRVLLLKPQTYMNLSGDAVGQAMRFHKVPLERVLVVSDDVSLPIGKLRIRRSGSAGGHKGLADIIQKCGGEEFPRIKIGVGEPPHPDYDMADWVLSSLRTRSWPRYARRGKKRWAPPKRSYATAWTKP